MAVHNLHGQAALCQASGQLGEIVRVRIQVSVEITILGSLMHLQKPAVLVIWWLILVLWRDIESVCADEIVSYYAHTHTHTHTGWICRFFRLRE